MFYFPMVKQNISQFEAENCWVAEVIIPFYGFETHNIIEVSARKHEKIVGWYFSKN